MLFFSLSCFVLENVVIKYVIYVIWQSAHFILNIYLIMNVVIVFILQHTILKDSY